MLKKEGHSVNKILVWESMYFLIVSKAFCLLIPSEMSATIRPGYNALEGTGPRERYRRESVIRGKVSGINKREIITIATFNYDP